MAEENLNQTEEVESTNESISSEGNKSSNAQENIPGFEIDSFNREFETTFEDKSSLKEALEARNRLNEIELELQQAKEKASKYDQVLEYYKPENLYGDEETYAFIELKKKFPDKDLSIVSKIRSSEFDSMSDLDKLVLADKLRVKSKVSDAVRKEGILQRLGVEEDMSDWTDTDHYKISSALTDAIPVLNDIRNFKPDPKTFDLASEKEVYEKQRAEKRQQLTEKLKPFADVLVKNYKGPKAYSKEKDGQFNQIFDYVVDDNTKGDIRDQVIQVMSDANMEPTEDNLKQAMQYIDNHFKVLHFDKIVAAAIKKGQSSATEKAHNEIHNDTPVNTKEAPEVKETEALTLKERVRRGWNSS